MANKTKAFFEPLIGGDRKALVLWISVVILLVLKIFEGDQSFFVKHWGHLFENGPVLDWYKWLYHHLASLLLLAIIPVIIIRAYFKQQLKEFGITIGDWRAGLKHLIFVAVVMTYPTYLTCQSPQHLEFYPLTTLATESPKLFFLWALTYLPHYIGWEFFFRGYIGFGLKKYHGAVVAIITQTVLTTLMHIGKPEGETWGAAVAGIYFGLVAYRTRSVLWPLLMHLYLGLANSWFSGLAAL